MPSERMRADALAQTLVSRKWSKLLLLVGSSPQDQQRAATAQASIKRYGLQVVASKPFKLSTDPRERDLANPLLLTAGAAYDAVWVVDSDGEFARSLPYRTVLPRPVVGDAGLVALAWHAQFERYGAPQVSRRFAKAAKRPMTDHDWAAWMAGKALIASPPPSPRGRTRVGARRSPSTPVDGSKGVRLSFRAWDGQLRQTMLLTDGQGVIAQAPIEGLLHPTEVLDTSAPMPRRSYAKRHGETRGRSRGRAGCAPRHCACAAGPASHRACASCSSSRSRPAGWSRRWCARCCGSRCSRRAFATCSASPSSSPTTPTFPTTSTSRPAWSAWCCCSTACSRRWRWSTTARWA
jgi:hypothetical protein